MGGSWGVSVWITGLMVAGREGGHIRHQRPQLHLPPHQLIRPPNQPLAQAPSTTVTTR